MTATTSSAPPARPAPAPRPAIEAIVLDVDGTLLNGNHQLTARTEAAIKAAVAQGVTVVLATGKTPHACAWLVQKLGLKAPGIYLQGLYIVDAANKVLYEQIVSPAIARQVITYAEDRGFTILAYNGPRIMVRAASKEAESATVKYHEPAPEVVGALQNLLPETRLHKLLVVGDPRQITALRWQLGIQLGGAARLMQAGLPHMLEILPPGGSKATALRHLLKELGIKPEAVLAIGDAENDIEMIELAGVGVAMGNASDKVKAAAKHVTATNEEDGVGLAIEKYVLPPPASVAPSSAAQQTDAAPVQTEAAASSQNTAQDAQKDAQKEGS